MKKILMGLLAVSALSYAAPIQVTNPAKNDSSIFNPVLTQEGSIKVQATLTADITVVKYMVFANTTDSIDGAKDELTLTDFVIKSEAGAIPSDAGFSGTNPNLYVKRVVDGVLQPLIDEDRLSVALYRPGNNSYWEFVKENTTQLEDAFGGSNVLGLMSTENFDALATATGLTKFNSVWLKDSNGNGVPIKQMTMNTSTKGVLTFVTSASNETNSAGELNRFITDETTINKWNEFFAQGVAFNTHVKIIVR